ncbi:MAG: hypothetical protein ACD_45C00147G0001 [uncultured bacterium]|nr:MAG: hypothetical protein ACD_45C00147G0001 [uncultured bacterium]
MRASNGLSLPRAASTDIAPATIADTKISSVLNKPISASAVDTCVPFNNANPSFAPNRSGFSWIFANASSAEIIFPA